MCQHLPLSPPFLSSSCEGGCLAVAAHTEGSQSPGGLSQATASFSRTPLVGLSTPFTLRPPFHTAVLTVNQLESCSRPPLQHTARGNRIKVFHSCKRFKPCVKLESVHTPSHSNFAYSHRHRRANQRLSNFFHSRLQAFILFCCCFGYLLIFIIVITYSKDSKAYMNMFACNVWTNHNKAFSPLKNNQLAGKKDEGPIRKQTLWWNQGLFVQNTHFPTCVPAASSKFH